MPQQQFNLAEFESPEQPVRQAADAPKGQPVVVKGVRLPMWDLVCLLVQLAVAAIPAAIILGVVLGLVASIVSWLPGFGLD